MFCFHKDHLSERRCPICLSDFVSVAQKSRHKAKCHRYVRAPPAEISSLPAIDNIFAVVSRDPNAENRFLCDTRSGEREWVDLPPDNKLRKQFEKQAFPDVENMENWANGLEICDDSEDNKE